MQDIRRKIVPIAGDLIVDKLGLSQADRAMVTAETNIIINCAASVSFTDPLLDAIEINYNGCGRMLALAKECQRIECFTHVSTAYVNCNLPTKSVIEEKVYDLPGNQDPEEIIKNIVRMGPQQVKEQETQILGTYPNTYTFTKSLAERMIKKNRGNLRVALVRPSIVTGCYEDPFRGWTDSIAAAGFQTMMCINGLLHFIRTNEDTVLDVVPCDFVSNQILVQTAFAAKL